MSFYETLKAAGYTDLKGIVQADEFAPGSWIFTVFEREEEIYTVNLFTNGDFAGFPLNEFESREQARGYVTGWIDSRWWNLNNARRTENETV